MSEKQAKQREALTPRSLNRKRVGWKVAKPFLFIVIWILVIYAGMSVGYVVLGKGSASDVSDFGTWKHVFDLVFAK